MSANYYPIIAGPTASGKTSVSVMLAHRIGGEVVSADSMQIYDSVQIGTARPTNEEMQGIRHHLQGFLPIHEKYSVARYVEDANSVFADVFARKRTPILCGGTGLYIQSFMENRTLLPHPTDEEYREALKNEIEVHGGGFLLEQLRAVDPQTAERLHPNDHHRIIRALEIFHVSGMTISQQDELSHSTPSPYRGCLFVLNFRNRERLYDRINRRVDAMMRDGVLEEAKYMLQVDPQATALQAIGYKELIPYLAGECTLPEAVEKLKTETRHYAKRQLSWFRRMDNAEMIYVDDYTDLDVLVDDLVQRYNTFKRSDKDGKKEE